MKSHSILDCFNLALRTFQSSSIMLSHDNISQHTRNICTEATWWFEKLKQSVHFQSEISLIFWENYQQTRAKSSNKQSKLNAQKNNKVYNYAFKMRNLPRAHKAWLLRTRNAGGVCSSVPM